MNTIAMILTVTGLSICFIPGMLGWLGVGLASMGTAIGIIGLTTPKTSPAGLGMDVAAWIYGTGTAAVGMGFQIKYGEGALDSLLLPISMTTAICIAAILVPFFVSIQIVARKRLRYAGIGIAYLLHLAIVASICTALVHAHRFGINLT